MPRSALQLLTCSFCFVQSLALLAQTESSSHELLDNLDRYIAQLEAMESESGRYNQSLVEPLTLVARAAMELNQFDNAAMALDRAIQISRINEGLYTKTQYPLLTLQVENDARRSNWKDANKTLEHLYWLYTDKHQGIDESVVNELLRLSNFHIEAVAADDFELQSYHFRNAANISWVALRVAKLLWGEYDQRLVPLQYNLVKQYYLQAVAIDRGGQTGYELREVVPGSTWVRSRQEVNRGLHLTGSRLLKDMRAVYQHADSADSQAAAMAELYLADWQLLFTRQSAANDYQVAFNSLTTSGIDNDELQNFFAVPVLLPEQEFYPSIELAMAARVNGNRVPLNTANEPAVNIVRFNEWAASFPDVEFPLGIANIRFSNQQDWGSAMLSFSLGGLEKVSRWVNGRYVTRISVPETVEILSQHPEPTLELKGFTEKLHYVHFRPRLINGTAEPASGTMQYLFSKN